ncbi:MAG TPA: zf-HC2 domain-containing protein, partial [Candidatus Eisenbacteria bacterium]
MTCAEAKLKLEPCVSGTLSPEDRIALEEHLAICEGCRLELELTRAIMGAPPPEGADEPPAPAPEPHAPAPEPPSLVSEAPPSMPVQGEARASTPLFDEISFADLGSEPPTAGSPPGAASVAGEKAPGLGDADPFANFTTKPDEPAEQTSATWDFEPADVPRDSSPPEGSLSFANEALKRKREVDEKRKTALVRLALWGGGIGCGLILLGVSVWIALAFRQEKAPEFGPNGEIPSVAPPDTATPARPEPTATPNVPDGSSSPAPVTTQPTTSTQAQTNASAPTQPAPE